jgi:Zn-dependent metalloprotease
MTRCSLHCILPPDLLRRAAEAATGERREALLRSLQLDRDVRAARRTAAFSAPLLGDLGSTPAIRLDRVIYDQLHSDERIAGMQVRGEGEPASGDPAVDEAYDGFGATHQLFAEVFERNSIDDRGMSLLGMVHYGDRYDNAFWDGEGHMWFGDGDDQLLVRTTKGLDVIGHELSHGVTQHEADLAYSGQSGALNESISDVFGSLVRQRHLGQAAADADWLIGADIVGPELSPALRSMASPGTANRYDTQPAHMDGYVVTDDDDGGVHTNSGIPNHAFYVVATTVGGPAWEAPGRIWYDALCDAELKSDADFAQFAAVTLDRATDRYGATSAEADAVRAGWDAVGVDIG